MTKFIAPILTAFIVTLSACADNPPLPIQGDWKPIATGAFTFFPEVEWKVTADAIVWNPGPQQRTFSYKLDPVAVPAAIDLTPLDGDDKGTTIPGIYLRDGDYLEVCIHERPKARRPRAFVAWSSRGGNRSFIFVKSQVIADMSVAARSRYNLKIIGLALHGYVDQHGKLPPAFVADATAKPLTSWRVHICPHMEQRSLYQAVDKSVAWDDPANRVIAAVRLKAYTSPRPMAALGETPYLALVGKGMPFEGRTPQPLPADRDLATTVLVVESPDAVAPWAKPVDLPYDADKPLPALGGVVPGGFHVLLADGSVRFVKEKFNEKVFRQMLPREKAQPVKWDDLVRE